MTVLVLHVYTCTCTADMGMYMYMCICEYVLHTCILCNPYSHEERLGNIRESVDSLCRDGADTPIVCVHWKAFLTREYSRFKPFSAREWPI